MSRNFLSIGLPLSGADRKTISRYAHPFEAAADRIIWLEPRRAMLAELVMFPFFRTGSWRPPAAGLVFFAKRYTGDIKSLPFNERTRRVEMGVASTEEPRASSTPL